MSSIETRLAKLGIALPEAPKPIAAYVPAVRSGKLLFVSGQLPLKDGQLVATGRVPSQVPVTVAQHAAAQCAINALAIVKAELDGDWSNLKRVVRLGALVASDDQFADQAQVANGASELLVDVMGKKGRHARAAVGVNALPLGASVEVEFIFELKK